MNPQRCARWTAPAFALIALSLSASAVPPGNIVAPVPPPALDAGTTTQLPIAVNTNSQKISTDAAFRKTVAGRIQIFLDERGFADPKVVPNDKAKKAYWPKISKKLEAALKIYPSSGAIVYEILGPAEGRQQPERKAKEDRLDGHDLLQPIHASLEGADSSQDWILAFLAKATDASLSILRGPDLNPREITRRDEAPAAPKTDGGSLALGALTAGHVALGAGPEMYRGGHVLAYGDRQLSPRLYARDDGKGGITYNIEIWDVTNPDDPHGVAVPLDASGQTKFTLTDQGGKSRDYVVSFTPYKHASGTAPWEGDTNIAIAASHPDGSSTTHSVWLKYLLAERADEAWAGGHGKTLTLGGKTYYTSAQGGESAGLMLYDADQLKAFEQGQLDPLQALPSAVANTTQRKAGVDVAVGPRAKIIGTDFDLVYDPSTHLWSPDHSLPGSTPPPGSGAPDAGGGTPSTLTYSGGSSAGTDTGWPDTFSDGYQNFNQSYVNGQLGATGVAYRIYQAQDDGPYVAVAKKAGGGVSSVRTTTTQTKDGKTVTVAAYCCGSAANGDQFFPGTLSLVGRTFIFSNKAGKNYIPVEKPYSQIGSMGSNGVVSVNDKSHVADVLKSIPDRGGSVDDIMRAMEAKIKELKGSFRSMEAMQSDDGWGFFVMTSETTDYFPNGKFYGKGANPGAPPTGGPGHATGGKPPPQKQMEYTVDSSTSAPPDLFPPDQKLGQTGFHRQKYDKDRGWASYSGDDGSCAIRWRIFDGAGKPTDNMRIWQVAGGNVQGSPGDPCKDPAKFEVKALRVAVPIVDLKAHWEGNQFGVWNQATNDANKNDAKAFIDWVIQQN